MTRYGYARVSTAEQNLEAQIDKLIAAGVAPENVFTDKASGTRARRPRWDVLREMLVAGDVLVTVRLDRIGRSVRNLVDVTAWLDARDVGLIVTDQSIDTTSPGGRLTFHILAAIAEFERELIVERTKDGQAAVRRMGNLRRSLGGTPALGYRDDGGDDSRDWTVDRRQADWLAEAAERVVNGEPVEAVHRALPEMTDATGRTVNVKMLRTALTRPASAGLIMADGEVVATADLGDDEPPLSEFTFNRLAAIFGARKRGRPTSEDRYPLGPVLRCAVCKNQLTGMPGYKKRGYYACRNPHKSLGVLEPCHGVSVPADDVHQIVARFIAEWSASPAGRLAAGQSAQTSGRRGELDSDLGELQEQMADVLDKRRYMQPARYERLVESIAAQIDLIAAELDALDAIDAEPAVPAVIDWDAMTPAEKIRTLEEAAITPLHVQPGNGGGAALSAADRIELAPRK